MTTTSTFHPLQSYKHLCNRLDTNTGVRDAILSEIATENRRHEEKLRELEQRLPDVVYARKKLLEEGHELLPSLQGFRKCYDTLKSILGVD